MFYLYLFRGDMSKLTCVCSSSMLEEFGEKALGERGSMALGPATTIFQNLPKLVCKSKSNFARIKSFTYYYWNITISWETLETSQF